MCNFEIKYVEAIFIPISERFFLSSHTGLWRLCRYALTPILMTNSTLPQLLTKLIVTNASELAQLKKDIAQEAYIEEYLTNFKVPIANVTAIDNQFRQALFAQWIRNSTDFPKFKAKYKQLITSGAVVGAPLTASSTHPSQATAKTRKNTQFVIANNLTLIREKFGTFPIVAVHLNDTTQSYVIVPRNLQWALFEEWPEKPHVVRVLGKFADDMGLSPIVTNSNGTQVVLRPPDPPYKGNRNSDYVYAKYGKLLIYIFIL